MLTNSQYMNPRIFRDVVAEMLMNYCLRGPTHFVVGRDVEKIECMLSYLETRIPNIPNTIYV